MYEFCIYQPRKQNKHSLRNMRNIIIKHPRAIISDGQYWTNLLWWEGEKWNKIWKLGRNFLVSVQFCLFVFLFIRMKLNTWILFVVANIDHIMIRNFSLLNGQRMDFYPPYLMMMICKLLLLFNIWLDSLIIYDSNNCNKL